MSTVQMTAPERRSITADGSWMAWTAAGLAGIWVAVVMISLLAPDMVSGSQQEHLQIAAFTTWFWGLIATGPYFLVMVKLRGNTSRRPIWVGLAVATLVTWLAATVLSITVPPMVTGTDPTSVPLGAMITPMAAAVLTFAAGITAGVFSRLPD